MMTPDQYRREGAEAMKKAAAEAAYQWWDDDDAQDLREHVRAIDPAEVLAKVPQPPTDGICDYRTEWHVTTSTSGNELPGKPEPFGIFTSERDAKQALADAGFTNGEFGWRLDPYTSARIREQTIYSNYRPAEVLTGLPTAPDAVARLVETAQQRDGGSHDEDCKIGRESNPFCNCGHDDFMSALAAMEADHD